MNLAVLIAVLAGTGYLAHLWLGERATNALLRAEIAVLKRRLARRAD
jgi:hypothetical protein